MDKEAISEECRVGWLSIEKDFKARLTKPESLKYALQIMGRNPSDRAIQRYWTQCGGSMSFDQFSLVMRREKKASMSDLMRAFRKIDTNGDGYITAEELQRKLTKHGEKMSASDIQAIVAEADQNGDGKLDYAEFCHMLLNTSEECIQASYRKAMQDRELKRPGKFQSDNINPRRMSSERRERHREEIRMHLYSPNNDIVNEHSGTIMESNDLQLDSNTESPTTRELDTPSNWSVGKSEAKGSCLADAIITEEDKIKRSYGHKVPLEPVDAKKMDISYDRPSKLPRLKKKRLPSMQTFSIDVGEKSNNRDSETSAENDDTMDRNGGKKDEENNGDVQELEIGAATKSKQHKYAHSRRSSASKEDRQTDHLQKATLISDNRRISVTKDERDSVVKEGSSDESAMGEAVQGSEIKEELEDRQVCTSENKGLKEDEAKLKKNGKMGTDIKKESETGVQSSVTVAPPTSVIIPPPKKPKNIESWNSITGKGCFYLDTDDEAPEVEDETIIKCHHYRLKLPAATNVWIEVGVDSPGIRETDVLLFVFRTDENEDATDIITYTQHKVNDRWLCRMDLDPGTYALVPFTSGCYLKPSEENIDMTVGVPLTATKKGSVVLTQECLNALEEIYYRLDLDGNGYVSRTEFDFFQEVTSGEICDDDAWNIITTNFDVTNDEEITLKGFIALHEMTAADEEGGEEEIWQVMKALGYNKQLQLSQACPFLLEVFTDDCEGEIEILDYLFPFTPIVNPALSQLVVEKGVAIPVEGGEEELAAYTFTTPHMTTIAVENKSSKKAHVQLDCSRSVNCISSRESTVYVLEVEAHSLCIGYHIQQADPQAPHSIHCSSSMILA